MTHYPTVTCPVCQQRVASGLPGQLTPAHHAAMVICHQGVCEKRDDDRWPGILAAAREIVDVARALGRLR